jgi:hypothetical protein
MRGHATIDNKYIKYGMLDNISLCGCPIPTPPVIAVAVALFCECPIPTPPVIAVAVAK